MTNNIPNLLDTLAEQVLTAQHEAAKELHQLEKAYQKLVKSVSKAKKPSAEAAAQIYLQNAQLDDTLADLRAYLGRIQVLDERQKKLFEGTLLRVRDAVEFAQDRQNEADSFERAQLLVHAARDFATRLAARGLLQETINMSEAVVYEAVISDTTYKTSTPTGSGSPWDDFALAA